MVELTDEQADDLSLGSDSRLLGCGKMACAYAASDGRVVKFTKDARDALASYIIANIPAAGEGWAIPIHGVYRLEQDSKIFIIIAALAEPIDEETTEAIDWVYKSARKYADVEELIEPKVWRGFVSTAREIADRKETPIREDRLEAIEAVDRAVRGFHRLGLDWQDFHSGNFGSYGGQIVTIDLGLSWPVEQVPADVLARAGVEYL